MGREISLFSGYDQPENRTTNYCLLVLRMLYQENPALLAQALAALLPGQTGVQVGMQFRQQVGRGTAVPDGVLSQPAFTVYIETKHIDWHNDEQLTRHLEALIKEPIGTKVLVALAKFEGNLTNRFSTIEQRCAEVGVAFSAASFEHFLAAVRSATLPLVLSSQVDDFEQYLNEQGLLPNWRGWLDAVNCGEFHSQQEKFGVYVCPAMSGSYSHQRCEYLGLYWHKAVRQVASILGVVDVDPTDSGEATVLWNNDATAYPNTELIALARERFATSWPGADWEGRVFVLGPLYATNFQKDSSGGMRSTKQYFDVRTLKPTSAEDLAVKLQDVIWGTL